MAKLAHYYSVYEIQQCSTGTPAAGWAWCRRDPRLDGCPASVTHLLDSAALVLSFPLSSGSWKPAVFFSFPHEPVKSSVFCFALLKRTVQLASWMLRSVLTLRLMKIALTGYQAAAVSIFTSRKRMGASRQALRRIIKHILHSLFSIFRIPWPAEPTPQTASCSNTTLCCIYTEMSQPPPNQAGTWSWASKSHVKLLLFFWALLY